MWRSSSLTREAQICTVAIVVVARVVVLDRRSSRGVCVCAGATLSHVKHRSAPSGVLLNFIVIVIVIVHRCSKSVLRTIACHQLVQDAAIFVVLDVGVQQILGIGDPSFGQWLYQVIWDALVGRTRFAHGAFGAKAGVNTWTPIP